MIAWLVASIFLSDAQTVPAVERVAALQRQLSDPDYVERQRATLALRNGPSEILLPDLLEVVRQGPPEATARAVDILMAWYSQPKTVSEPLEDAVEQLRTAKGVVRERALAAWDEQQTERDKRAVAKLEELGAKVQIAKPKRDDITLDDDVKDPAESVIEHVVLGRAWRGGDEGLKYIARLSFVQTGVYRVKTAKVSEEALQRLSDQKPDLKVEIRGAFLGVKWMSGGAFGFGGPQPCLINEVTPKSPAEKAGLKKDDIIVKFGDKPVETFPDLIDLLKSTDPGEKVVFTVMRDGEELKLPVELSDW